MLAQHSLLCAPNLPVMYTHDGFVTAELKSAPKRKTGSHGCPRKKSTAGKI
jgi:hypothetical protein